MENTFRDPGFTFDDENQVLIFIKDSVLDFLSSCVGYFLTAMHFIFLPVVLMYSFWAHALEQTWQITKHVSNEVFELLKIVPLTFEIWFWSVLIFVEVLLFFMKLEEAAVQVEKNVYEKIKEILRRLKAFPLSAQNAAALYSFVKKIPVFGKGRLPFPNFLFEETFTSVQFRRGTVAMTVTAPTDLPQTGNKPQTTTEASAPTSSDQTRTSVTSPAPSADGGSKPTEPKSTESKSAEPKSAEPNPTEPSTTATQRKSAAKSAENPTASAESSTPKGSSESDAKAKSAS